MPIPLRGRPPTTRQPDGDAIADEAALVADALRDRPAFAPLYARYLDPIHRYCYRRLGSREAAEDATSQIFTRALAALPGFRGDSFRSWLFAIAHNIVADSYRTARTHAPLTAAVELTDPTPGPEDLAVVADRHRALEAALAQLPEGQRRVVELRLAGLRGADISQVLGRNPATVRSDQLRAVSRLRRLLGIGEAHEEATNGS